MDAPLRARILKRGLRLEYATLAWNVVGVVLVLWAAAAARSVALAGFGLDSLIEILASIVVVWQLTGIDANRERRALRLIGAAFFALAIYVLGQSMYVLQLQLRPSPSPGGIAWLALTVAAMLAGELGVGGDRSRRREVEIALERETRAAASSCRLT